MAGTYILCSSTRIVTISRVDGDRLDAAWRKLLIEFVEFLLQLIGIINKILLAAHEFLESAIAHCR